MNIYICTVATGASLFHRLVHAVWTDTLLQHENPKANIQGSKGKPGAAESRPHELGTGAQPTMRLTQEEPPWGEYGEVELRQSLPEFKGSLAEEEFIVVGVRRGGPRDGCSRVQAVSHAGNAVQVFTCMSKLQILAPTRPNPSQPFQVNYF